MKPQKLRARVLAEWRGLPEVPFPQDTAKPIGDALGKVMKALGLSERLHEDEMLHAWKDLVGEFFAKHSAPHRLKDGTLYINVLQPTVHFELERVWKRDILAKLKKRFGGRVIREVRFRLG
jgi:predicted nucleic acid-binding Zn ribbon protein